METFIATRGRVDRQITLNSLQGVIKPKMVVPECEAKFFDDPLVVPDDWKFSDVRQFIAQQPGDLHLCLDDDLRFYHRKDDTKLHKCRPEEIAEMLHFIEQVAAEYDHGSISAREGNHTVKEDIVECSRAMRAHFYRPSVLKGFDFRDVVTKQDFHMTLSLLRKGIKNAVIYRYAQNQDGYAQGGCQRYRTPEVMVEGAHRLKELHPDFVDVVTRNADWSGPRVDVRIQWKKAFYASQAS